MPQQARQRDGGDGNLPGMGKGLKIVAQSSAHTHTHNLGTLCKNTPRTPLKPALGGARVFAARSTHFKALGRPSARGTSPQVDGARSVLGGERGTPVCDTRTSI